jgi:hypothetical protein
MERLIVGSSPIHWGSANAAMDGHQCKGNWATSLLKNMFEQFAFDQMTMLRTTLCVKLPPATIAGYER